jgi:integrase
LRTDGEVLRIMRALPAPFDAVFFVANRSGARLSEVLSLRLSDLDELDAGVVRLRYAGEDGTGWLKEAHGPRTKYAPLPPDDARAVLAPLLEARRAAGAEPEAFLFVDAAGARIDRHAVTYRWRIARAALELPKALNFYRATRHSAASRALASGASVDEISQSLGHANPAITAKHYLHHVRKTFSPILTAGLGLDAEPAKVISLAARKGADA